LTLPGTTAGVLSTDSEVDLVRKRKLDGFTPAPAADTVTPPPFSLTMISGPPP
jgi:hypothetical protein